MPSIMRYKVHQTYINPEGTVVPAGEYEEHEIDLAIARNRSFVTLVDSNVTVTTTTFEDGVTEKVFDSTPQSDLPIITMKASETHVTVNKLNINTATDTQIAAVKHVGKATATKVLNERKLNPFTSYSDLDKRVPLPKGRKWEDTVIIDFESSISLTLENHVNFI